MSLKYDSDDYNWALGIYEKLKNKMYQECVRIGTKIPYTPINGSYIDVGEKGIHWWTNGFWGGILWQMYHATKDDIYRDVAIGVEDRLDRAMEEFIHLDHDVGFMWLHTSVAHYRLTGNEKSRNRGLHAANILAGRYNLNGNYICAWNDNRPGVMIVDCLMNLPLLYWASNELNDPRFKAIAINHTETALHYMLRPDGSSNHIVVFDSNTGQYLDNPGGQGYESGSSWTRGQAWAIYGMALAYRYTRRQEFLDAAKRSAHYFIANVALNGYVSTIDFRAPESPKYLDTTATVCAACGLLELATFLPEYEKNLYTRSAICMLKAIDTQFCNWDPSVDSIVSYGSAKYHREEDREVPIIYGDYFFIEGILRILDKNFHIW